MDLSPELIALAHHALLEDRWADDRTGAFLQRSLAATLPAQSTRFVVRAKATGVFSGSLWIAALREASALEHLRPTVAEGARIVPGDVVCEGEGPWRMGLALERTLLNGLQLLSGVATRTQTFVERVGQAVDAQFWPPEIERPQVLHTRKTLPLWRDLQIQAVLAGGGHLHRRDLADRVLLKENHKYLAQKFGCSFSQLLATLVANEPQALVEVESIQEAIVARDAGVKFLMLDNFGADLVHDAIRELRVAEYGVSIEVSGGLNLESISQYVIPGVKRLSVGALTHGAGSLDLSMDWG